MRVLNVVFIRLCAVNSDLGLSKSLFIYSFFFKNINALKWER